MVDCGLLGGVVIVCQEVEEVQRLVESVDGVALASVLQGGGNCHRDEEPLLPGLVRLGLEGLSHLLDEGGVVGAVLRSAPGPLGGVLPVKVDTVKVVLSEEPDGGFDEHLAPVSVLDQGAEPPAALIPASNSEHGLQVFVVGLQCSKLSESTYNCIFVNRIS